MIFETLSYWKFKDLKWRLPDTVSHCRGRPTLALTRRDLRSACRASPIGFATTPDGLVPVLLNAPHYNQIADFEDRWFHLRLPGLAALYPFSIVWQDREKQWVLGVARDPSLVGVEEGEPFFTPDGPLTRRLMVAYRRLCIAQAYRGALIEAANRLLAGDFLEDIPPAPKLRQRYKVMRIDRLDDLARTTHELDLELGYAAAFSLRILPESVAETLTCFGNRPGPLEPLFRSVLDLNARKPLNKEAGAGGFLVDDDDTLKFSFSARNSVFKSG